MSTFKVQKYLSLTDSAFVIEHVSCVSITVKPR